MQSGTPPPSITAESLTLSGGALHIRIRARDRLLVAEVAAEAGRKAAPLLAAGTELSASIDLSTLPFGEYAISARGGGPDAIPLGHLTAAPYAAQGAGATRIAQSSFRRSDGTSAWAALYIGPQDEMARLRLSASDDIADFLAGLTAAAARDARPLRYSVISPVYNVEKYLDAFFESLIAQTLPFKRHIELVMVDDGSTDNSARVIRRWQKKYSGNIVYLHKENGGISTARNAGMAVITNDWFTFIDPDDFVSPDFFERADAAIRRRGPDAIAAVSESVVHYMEETGAESDGHPLRYRFRKGERAVPAQDLGDDFQITVCGTFWRKDIVARHNLAFDARIRPGSEDAHFAGRYFMRAGDAALVFQPTGRYYHRRRADQSSLSQTGWMRPQSYDDELRYGYLALIADARQQTGTVPQHIQKMLLYCLSWAYRRAVDQPEAVAFLTPDQRQTYRDLLRETLSAIAPETLASFTVNLPHAHRAGLSNIARDADLPTPVAVLTDIDSHGLARLTFWSRDPGATASFSVDGAEAQPAYGKARRIDFLGDPLVYEHIRWVPVAGGRLTVTIGGKAAEIEIGTRRYADGLPVADIRKALVPAVAPDALLPRIARDLRRAASTPEASDRFRNAWLFIDRDNEADDSAEYLYRYARAHAPEINAFFLLSRSSRHWARLEADGFRLLAFNEAEHAVALLHADHLISSQADHYVVDYLGRAEFGDRLKYRFTFLQHGVTQADFSGFFNRTHMDLVAASTFAEHEAFVADGTRYRLTAKEVKLTGLPRHDALLEKAATDEKTLIIMPTWRYALTGRALGAGNARSENPAFYASAFARTWKSLLHAPRLAEIASGHSIVFVPHPNLEQYLPFFELPSTVEVVTFGSGTSLQPVFRGMSAFLTDYSSKAFDAAYLYKPVVYYQFDTDAYFGGGHTGAPGYFDFSRDGFGPVAATESETLDAIAAALQAGASTPQPYRSRAEQTFAFRDGRCSERILAEIRRL